jgi:hypothetical protein
MSKKLVDYLKQDGVITVFDVDGVLAPYEYGDLKHCVSDEEWLNGFSDSDNNLYSKMRGLPFLHDFIKNKNIDDVYVCSQSDDYESVTKIKFVTDNYNIKRENIYLVKDKSMKVDVLNEIRDMRDIPENKIAIIEDTIKTLDAIAEKHNYVTVYISSFFDFEE